MNFHSNRAKGKKAHMAWWMGCLTAMFTLVITTLSWADETKAVLLKKALADAKGKQATMLTVEYAPGASSHPHIHPGSVFAYVLEGAVVSQLDQEAPVTYTKGQSWYESPRTPHVMSRNASLTEPARLLVLLLSEEDEPLTVPIK